MCLLLLASDNKFIEGNKYNKERTNVMLYEKICVDPYSIAVVIVAESAADTGTDAGAVY